MKKYALLVALAIAPSLAHDNLEIEGKSNLVSNPKLALHTETHHSHLPLVIDQDPFNDNDSTEAKIAKRENLETLIDKAEKTIAKLDALKDDHLSEKYLESSQGNDQSKFAFNKWAGLNQNPSTNYISGGSSGASGGANGGGASGGSSGSSGGGKTPSDGKTASNGNNPESHDGSVVATAVPEPEVYLMFIAGLGLIGYRAKKHFSK
jgi:uncharacterized membrane protein YgcG